MAKVTDPRLLAQLNGGGTSAAPRQAAAPPQIMLPGAIATAKLPLDIDQTKAATYGTIVTAKRTEQQMAQDAAKIKEDEEKQSRAVGVLALNAGGVLNATMKSIRDSGQHKPGLGNALFQQNTGWAAMFNPIPQTNAGQLKARLDYIKANLGLDKLQELRANSPTGASGLGNLTEKEMVQLVESAANLKPSLGEARLDQGLRNIQYRYVNLLKSFGYTDAQINAASAAYDVHGDYKMANPQASAQPSAAGAPGRGPAPGSGAPPPRKLPPLVIRDED